MTGLRDFRANFRLWRNIVSRKNPPRVATDNVLVLVELFWRELKCKCHGGIIQSRRLQTL